MTTALSKAALVGCLREAGAVARCHTFPHCGDYSVGQHSWDAASLLLALHPHPTIALVKAVLWHDVAERWTGDVPAVAKWRSPELVDALALAEARVFDALGIQPLDGLTLNEQIWLHAVDKLELWLWCKDQLQLGNRRAAAVLGRLDSWFVGATMAGRVPTEIGQVLREYQPGAGDELLRTH